MAHLDDAAVWRYSARLCSEEETAAIRRHLAGCEACSARIEEDTGGSVPSEGAAPEPPPGGAGAAPDAPLERGASLGRYLVLEPVGQGGMGVVYAAYDPELNRKVAIKLLRVRPDGTPIPLGQARMLREAQAMARVSHPNVISVYDVGTFGDRVFVAMEFVEGMTLRAWLQEKKRPWAQVLEVFMAAGRGLAAAHSAGLVHRDFKPENVLMGQDGRARVTDFGLARLADADDEPPSLSPNEGALLLTSSLTQAGKLVGTPYYMSPEQHAGLAPDARSDQFSFCAALYLAVYGKRPFDPVKLRQRVLPPKPPQGTPEGGAPAPTPAPEAQADEPIIQEPPRDVRVPGFIRRAVLRGLSLEPQDRFGSMEELLAGLSHQTGRAVRGWAAVAGLATLAAIGFTYQNWADRREALCGGVEEKLEPVWNPSVQWQIQVAFKRSGKPYAASSWEAVRGTLNRYAKDWAHMHVEACRATRVRGEQSEAVLSLRMGCLEQRLKEFGATAALFAQADEKVLDRAVDAAAALPPLASCADLDSLSAAMRPPESSSARVELSLLEAQVAQAKALNEAGKYRAGLEVAKKAVAGARKLDYRPLLAEALYVQGWLQDHIGDLPGAEKSFVESVWVAEAGRHDEAKVIAASSLVRAVGQRQARPAEGRLWAGLAHAALARLGAHEELRVGLGLAEGNMLAGEGRHGEALTHYEAALELANRVLPPEHPWVGTLYGDIGMARGALGDRSRAVEALRKAVALNEQARGAGHPATASSHNKLSAVLLEAGDSQGALEHALKALEVWRGTLGQDAREVAAAHGNLGAALAQQGRFAEALLHQERALAIKERMLPSRHPGLSYPLDGIGHAYLELGRPEEAVLVLERALGLKNQDPALLANARFHLAQALAATGRPKDRERARALAVQAREGYLALGRRADANAVERFRDHLSR